jgi:50S ribosomal protein L16 3-hydroxylase
VGKHYDHFSVFLVQLNGRRQWAVGPRANQDTPLVPNQPLRLVDLAADDHVVASPGDVLYLPPGVIHHGVAMDPDCMTLSIGFRAPDAGALFETLVEQLDDSETWFRFDDPDRHTEGPSAAITAEDLVRTRAQLLNFLDRPGVLERILATRMMRLIFSPSINGESRRERGWHTRRLDSRFRGFGAMSLPARAYANWRIRVKSGASKPGISRRLNGMD